MKASGLLRDSQGNVWARFRNAEEQYGALVADCEIVEMPQDAQAVFRRFEELVSSQSFSLLEDFEEQLTSFDLWIIWEGEQSPTKVWDVQVAKSGITFRLDPVARP